MLSFFLSCFFLEHDSDRSTCFDGLERRREHGFLPRLHACVGLDVEVIGHELVGLLCLGVSSVGVSHRKTVIRPLVATTSAQELHTDTASYARPSTSAVQFSLLDFPSVFVRHCVVASDKWPTTRPHASTVKPTSADVRGMVPYCGRGALCPQWWTVWKCKCLLRLPADFLRNGLCR